MTNYKEIADSLTELYVTKEDLATALKQMDSKNPEKTADVLDHIKNCNEPDCEISKYKNELKEDSLAIGFLMGSINE